MKYIITTHEIATPFIAQFQIELGRWGFWTAPIQDDADFSSIPDDDLCVPLIPVPLLTDYLNQHLDQIYRVIYVHQDKNKNGKDAAAQLDAQLSEQLPFQKYMELCVYNIAGSSAEQQNAIATRYAFDIENWRLRYQNTTTIVQQLQDTGILLSEKQESGDDLIIATVEGKDGITREEKFTLDQFVHNTLRYEENLIQVIHTWLGLHLNIDSPDELLCEATDENE